MSRPTPSWLTEMVRQAKRGAGTPTVEATRSLLARLELPTVCESARCPNRGECFSHSTATFLILGDVCTRGCAFCAVKRAKRPQPPAHDEPDRLALAAIGLGLRHIVVTSVTRDDLEDGGAGHYAAVVRALRRQCPGVTIELLVPDFRGSADALRTVVASRPDILAHNIETVPRLYPAVRRGAEYPRSLRLLELAKNEAPELVTKSGLMLGLGETDAEVDEVLEDLRHVRCDMLTIGQYLAPSMRHARVERYLTPAEFGRWYEKALAMGFKSVASGPLVRSSYKAPVFYGDMQDGRGAMCGRRPGAGCAASEHGEPSPREGGSPRQSSMRMARRFDAQ